MYIMCVRNGAAGLREFLGGDARWLMQKGNMKQERERERRGSGGMALD